MTPGRAPVADVAAPGPGRARLGHAVGRLLVVLLYAARAAGRENVPARGPVLLAANHTGYHDGALVLAMAPRPRHCLVLAKTFEGVVLVDTSELDFDESVEAVLDVVAAETAE